MPDSPKETCATPTCTNQIKTKRTGLCSACVAWTTRHGGADPSARPGLASHPVVCVIDPCQQPVRVKRRGWCQACYEWWRQGKGHPSKRFAPRTSTRTCAVDGCTRTFNSNVHLWCSPCRRWSAQHGGADPSTRLQPTRFPAGCILVEDKHQCGKPIYNTREGWCRMHHTRWQRHGDPTTKRGNPHANTLEKILATAASIDPNEHGCRISTGAWSADKDGYPTVRLNGRRRRVSHLILEDLLQRPLQTGEQANHHCDTPPCVEGTHLFAGTHDDNMADMIAKGRKPRGAQVVTARLSDDQVRAIRRQYAQGSITQSCLAAAYGVGQTTISRIVRRASWAALVD